MDIEGGEYPIIDYFLENRDNFNFKKGTIEFHFLITEKRRNEIFLEFLKLLKQKKYYYYFFNNQHQIIDKEKVRKYIDRNLYYLINIHFYR